MFERCAELGIGGYAAGNQDARGVELLGGEHGAIDEIADDGVLKFANERESLRRAQGEKLIVFSFSALKCFLALKNFGAIFAVLAQMIENGG